MGNHEAVHDPAHRDSWRAQLGLATIRDTVVGDTDWRRIAALALDAGVGTNHVILDRESRFRRIKLQSRGADVEVFRWALRFEDGTILDLSVNCLLDGTESRPMLIAGRRLKAVALEYEVRRARWRSRLEIWAQR